MFEDEMTEEHMARTEEDYQRVTRQEIHDGKIDEMRTMTVTMQDLVRGMMEDHTQ